MIGKLGLNFIFIALVLSAFGQASFQYDVIDTVNIDGRDIKVYQKNASFPGGLTEFNNFLSRKLRYPKQARKSQLEGEVIVQFIVERNGALSSFNIKKSPGYGFGEEVIRVLKKGPKWKPGSQSLHGQNWAIVRQTLTQSVNFYIN